jgi:hypothetical protein
MACVVVESWEMKIQEPYFDVRKEDGGLAYTVLKEIKR